MDTNALELSWLAGFMDGEGSFHFRRAAGRNAGSFNYYYPAIRICNTHEETLATVRAILDQAGLRYTVSWRRPQNGNLPSWDVEARGAKALVAWLDLLIPYLRTKRGQAEDIRRYLELRAADRSFRDYSEEESAIIQRIAKRAVIKPKKVYQPVTECIHGHALTEDNVYVWNGKRFCRACRVDISKRAAERRKEQRHAKRRALVEQAPVSPG